MFNTKHLILIVASVATLALGIAAPTAGAAAKQQTVDDATCQEWFNWFMDDVWHAAMAQSGQEAQDYVGKAKWDLQQARDAGCPWAQPMTYTPGNGATPPTNVGATQGPNDATPSTTGGSLGITKMELSFVKNGHSFRLYDGTKLTNTKRVRGLRKRALRLRVRLTYNDGSVGTLALQAH